jgi:uncharacterized protein YecT (DUF1311 family)
MSGVLKGENTARARIIIFKIGERKMNGKKTKLLLLLLITVISACNYHVNIPQTALSVFAAEKTHTPPNAASFESENAQSALKMFEGVLLNEINFFDADEGEYITLEEYLNEHNRVMEKYAFIDTDSNGIPEMILAMSTSNFYTRYLVLRFYNEEVYSYALEGFHDFTFETNGEFVESAGAAYKTREKIRFFGSALDYDIPFTGNGVTFYVYDIPTNKNAFHALADEFWNTSDENSVKWYEYLKDTIPDIISDNIRVWNLPAVIPNKTAKQKQAYLDSLSYLYSPEYTEYSYDEGDDDNLDTSLKYYNGWDKELKKVFRLLSERLDETEMKELRLEQRFWMSIRNERGKYLFKKRRENAAFYDTKPAEEYRNKLLGDITKARTFNLIDFYFDGQPSKIKLTDIPVQYPGTYPDSDDFTFADLDGMFFDFSSGAGASSTSVEIFKDGTFEGYFVDSDGYPTGPGYPKGTRYICSFSGRFTSLKKTGAYEYSMKCDSLILETEAGTELIAPEDGYKYIYTEPYGFDNADEFFVYLPGKRTEDLPDEFISWVSMPSSTNLRDTEILEFYGLYNAGGQQGFR